MSHDGSIASQVEDWMVTQIRAIQFGGQAAFEAKDVQPWAGTNAGTMGQFAEELMSATRNRIARVLFVADRTEELADDQMKVVPTYAILIGLRDYDEGAARRGSVRGANTEWGTNAMRDLLKGAFNQQRPNLTDGVTHTDKSHYLGAQINFHSENLCVMKADVSVDEVPVSV